MREISSPLGVGTVKSYIDMLLSPFVLYLLPDALIVKGTTTGINTIQVSDVKTDDGYYNLAGQRVNADFKGIVIHHGRKMLKK